ncbi:MAG: FAD-dependent oxidoreductase [Pseudomonadales bacterium]|nr:FAD-dependent oxidoreductase [Pseudomonadales bacterium]
MKPNTPATRSILVVGAGPVGAAAALSLAERGYQITLVDRAPPQPATSAFGMDVRNVALSPRSAALLQKIDAWPEQAAAYHSMRVWEERGSSALDFAAASVNRQELGWLVEVGPLLESLWQRLEVHPNVQIVLGTTQRVTPGHHSIVLTLKPSQTGTNAQGQAPIDLTAEFLIACDGASSAVRENLGVDLRHWRTGQMALTTVVRTQQPHGHTAWQRFLLDGPLALLPSKDPYLCSIVWSQSEDNARARLALDDVDFCRLLTRASEGCLGEVQAVGPRQAFALHQQLAATAYPHARALLLGDALRVIHPLAGLGVNLGFEDLQALLDFLPPDTDLGVAGRWDKYARQRLLRSELVLRGLDGLRRLYAQDNPWVGWLRNAGVGWFSRRQWLQRKAIEEATGLNDLSS